MALTYQKEDIIREYNDSAEYEEEFREKMVKADLPTEIPLKLEKK